MRQGIERPEILVITQSTLLGILVLFVLLIGLQPEKEPYKKIFLAVSVVVGFVFMILHYSIILSYGVALKIFPFLLLEEYNEKSVFSLDWGQVVAMGIIINTYLYMREKRKNEKTSTITGIEVQEEGNLKT